MPVAPMFPSVFYDSRPIRTTHWSVSLGRIMIGANHTPWHQKGRTNTEKELLKSYKALKSIKTSATRASKPPAINHVCMCACMYTINAMHVKSVMSTAPLFALRQWLCTMPKWTLISESTYVSPEMRRKDI